MRLGDLSFTELRHRLLGPGLVLATGAYSQRIRSPLKQVQEGLHRLYAAYPVLPEQDFADFVVSVEPGPSWRTGWRSQARFRVAEHAPFLPLPQAQALPLLEWGLNWCVANRVHDRLVIHAAALEKNGQALILPGAPGAGKSTLCAALAFQGWRLMSDELTLLDPASGLLHPLPRPISLKNESIEVARALLPGAVFSPVVHDTRKGSVALVRAPDEAVELAGVPARPRWLVFPRYRPEPGVEQSALSRGQALIRLAEQGFNYGILGARGFETLADTIEACECLDLRYERLSDAVGAVERLSGRS